MLPTGERGQLLRIHGAIRTLQASTRGRSGAARVPTVFAASPSPSQRTRSPRDAGGRRGCSAHGGWRRPRRTTNGKLTLLWNFTSGGTSGYFGPACITSDTIRESTGVFIGPRIVHCQLVKKMSSDSDQPQAARHVPTPLLRLLQLTQQLKVARDNDDFSRLASHGCRGGRERAPARWAGQRRGASGWKRLGRPADGSKSWPTAIAAGAGGVGGRCVRGRRAPPWRQGAAWLTTSC